MNGPDIELTPEQQAAMKWAIAKAKETADEKDRRRQARQDSLVNPHRK